MGIVQLLSSFHRGRRRGLAIAVGVAVLAVAVALVLVSRGVPDPRAGATVRRPTGSPAPSSAGSTAVATLHHDVPRYPRPGAGSDGVAPGRWYGRPSMLPVIARKPGWVRVRLAQRPNGSTTWLRARDVSLGSTPYRLVVDLGDTYLRLYERGRLALSVPAGVGAPDDPTPAGHFFVAFDQAPPPGEPGYGPFIVVTSAHSEVISDWAGSGDAVVGIHGPLGEDGRIGTGGARISHGCIRLHDRSLRRLRQVPPGTPIDVVR
jgi:lipoprotein-anchoring transpeptidase ErfK/SrfK